MSKKGDCDPCSNGFAMVFYLGLNTNDFCKSTRDKPPCGRSSVKLFKSLLRGSTAQCRLKFLALNLIILIGVNTMICIDRTNKTLSNEQWESDDLFQWIYEQICQPIVCLWPIWKNSLTCILWQQRRQWIPTPTESTELNSQAAWSKYMRSGIMLPGTC